MENDKRAKGRKRKAEEAFQRGKDEASQEKGLIPAPKRAKYQTRAETRRGDNNPGEASNLSVKNTSSAIRGRKRKAEDAFKKDKKFSEQEDLIPAPKRAKYQTRAETRRGDNNPGVASNSGVKNTSSGAKGRKRKAEEAFQRGKDEASQEKGLIPAPKRAKYQTRAETRRGDNNPGEASNLGVKNTSSGGRGRKRKANDAFQKQEEEKVFPEQKQTSPAPRRSKRAKIAGTTNSCQKKTSNPGTSKGGNNPGKKKTSNPGENSNGKDNPGKKKTSNPGENSNGKDNPGKKKTSNPGENSNGKHNPGKKKTSNPGENSNGKHNPGKKKTSNPGENSNGKHNPGKKKTSNPGENSNGKHNPGKKKTSNPGENSNGKHNPGKKKTSNPGENSKGGENSGEKKTSSPEAGTSSEMKTPHKIKGVCSLVPFTSLYELGEKLGQGGQGCVYKAIRKSDGRKVAIKVIPKMYFCQFVIIPGHTIPLCKEIALNLVLSRPPVCPNVLQMYDWFEEAHDFKLILEYPEPCQTLLAFIISNGGRLSERVAQNLMQQAVRGAIHCINRGVVHGDIKLDNILVNTDTLQLKLIDFGFGNLIYSPHQMKDPFGGYYPYADLRKKAVVNTVQSLGVVLSKMANGLQSIFLKLDTSQKVSKDSTHVC